MSKIRTFQWSDVPAITKIWEDHHSDYYGLPNRRTCIIDAVVEEEGKVLGYGQVKLFGEAMLFLDKSASRRARANAFRLLMLEAFRGAEKFGLQELYAFVTDPDLSLLIQKHFKFCPADKPGELLIKEL
jgi:hypothetical protein